MIKGLKNKLAGQIGEFLVCAELGKRGLIATSFTGNVPEFDLIVVNEDLKTLPIQVKTSRADNWPSKADLWIDIGINHTEKSQLDKGNQLLTNPNLIYVCVRLAQLESDEVDQFFILTKSDLQNICSENYRKWMKSLNWKRPRNYESLDNRYSLENLRPYQNNWGLIINQMNHSNTSEILKLPNA